MCERPLVSNENIKTDVLFSLIVTVEFCHSSVNKYFVDSLFIYVIKKTEKNMYKEWQKKNPIKCIGKQSTKFGRSKCNTLKQNNGMSNRWICDIIAD